MIQETLNALDLAFNTFFVTCVNLNVFVRCVAGGAMTNVTVVFVVSICAANCTHCTLHVTYCHVMSRTAHSLSLSQHYQDHTFAMLVHYLYLDHRSSHLLNKQNNFIALITCLFMSF